MTITNLCIRTIWDTKHIHSTTRYITSFCCIFLSDRSLLLLPHTATKKLLKRNQQFTECFFWVKRREWNGLGRIRSGPLIVKSSECSTTAVMKWEGGSAVTWIASWLRPPNANVVFITESRHCVAVLISATLQSLYHVS